VDQAETDVETAHLLNALAPAVLAAEAKACHAWLVHYSTDYVFNGSGFKPWLETDQTGPLNVYGRTKLQGEQAIIESGCQYLIFRTSWVYSARGRNFAKTILRAAQEKEQLRVVNDQFGAPTGAELLADVTAHCVRQALQQPQLSAQLSGLYHLASAGVTTWYDYARFLIELARELGMNMKAQANSVSPITTQAYPLPALRPLNSRLAAHKLQTTFNLTLPPWQTGVIRMLTEAAYLKL
jgi:dTDP-4-dehydrorhamnose reductase